MSLNAAQPALSPDTTSRCLVASNEDVSSRLIYCPENEEKNKRQLDLSNVLQKTILHGDQNMQQNTGERKPGYSAKLAASHSSFDNDSNNDTIAPLKSRAKPFNKIGNLLILHVSKKTGRLYMIGPHWPFTVLMLVIHFAAGAGFAALLIEIKPHWSQLLVLACLYALTLVLFGFTVVLDPGVVFRPEDVECPSRTIELSGGAVELQQSRLMSHTKSTREKNRTALPEAGDTTSDKSSQESDNGYEVIYEWTEASGSLENKKPTTQPDADSTRADVSKEQLLHVSEEVLVSETKDENGARTEIVERRLRRTRRLWCSQCQLYVTGKTQHCDDCRVCISGYDHHCPWTSKCIGKKNLIVFYSWITSVFIVLFTFALVAASNASDKQNSVFLRLVSPESR